MSRFHVSRDETGYFQLAYEDDRGELTLISHQFESPKQLIEDAVHMAESGEFGRALVIVDPGARVPGPARAGAVRGGAGGGGDYRRPSPRKAGE